MKTLRQGLSCHGLSTLRGGAVAVMLLLGQSCTKSDHTAEIGALKEEVKMASDQLNAVTQQVQSADNALLTLKARQLEVNDQPGPLSFGDRAKKLKEELAAMSTVREGLQKEVGEERKNMSEYKSKYQP